MDKIVMKGICIFIIIMSVPTMLFAIGMSSGCLFTTTHQSVDVTGKLIRFESAGIAGSNDAFFDLTFKLLDNTTETYFVIDNSIPKTYEHVSGFPWSSGHRIIADSEIYLTNLLGIPMGYILQKVTPSIISANTREYYNLIGVEEIK